MYKKVFGKKLSRNRGSREALFRSLIRSLVLGGKMETTKIKAKAIQGDVDKLLGLVANDSLSSRRLVLSKLANDKEVADKLFEMKPITEKRNSGFTRIINLPARKGDNAPLARIEFVDSIEKPKEKKVKETK